MVDHLSIRERPAGTPIMHQDWGSLLFLHWPIPAVALRPLVDQRLEIEEYDGSAWITVAPFTMWGLRPPFAPALPYASRCHELNVRTYVHRDGVPGVWFFSLDASKAHVVWGARLAFHLPYFRARMSLESGGPVIRYRSERRAGAGPPASFAADWAVGEPLPPTVPGSLDYFLTERYALYAAAEDRLLRARIHHRPWPLAEARLLAYASTMLESHGLPEPSRPPILHGQAEPLHVEVWRPEPA